MGIVESRTASSDQLKGVETVAGMVGEIGIGEDSEMITAGDRGSVCVDINAVEDGGMIGEFD